MARIRRYAVLGALVAIPIVASGFLLQAGSTQRSQLLLEQVFSLVSNRFVDTLQDNELFEKAAHGLVRELNDPYSELLSPKDVKQFNTRTGGRYLFAVPWRGRTIVGTGYGPETTPVPQLAAEFLADARLAFPWAGLEREDVALVHDRLGPAAVGGDQRQRE